LPKNQPIAAKSSFNLLRKLSAEKKVVERYPADYTDDKSQGPNASGYYTTDFKSCLDPKKMKNIPKPVDTNDSQISETCDDLEIDG